MSKLSDLQQRIYQLVARGRTTPEIADELKLNPRSVEYHVNRIKVVLELRGSPMKAILVHAAQPSLL